MGRQIPADHRSLLDSPSSQNGEFQVQWEALSQKSKVECDRVESQSWPLASMCSCTHWYIQAHTYAHTWRGRMERECKARPGWTTWLCLASLSEGLKEWGNAFEILRESGFCLRIIHQATVDQLWWHKKDLLEPAHQQHKAHIKPKD